MSEAAARQVLEASQEMSRMGLCPGKSGNVSGRVDGGFVITPSGMAYECLTASDMVTVDLAGHVVAGTRRPSSETVFHAAIYRVRPEIGAIVHTHSPQATALSCSRRPIPPFHYMVAVAGGFDIRCAEYATFGTEELAESAVRALAGRTAALLANHGVIALGRTPAAALALAAEVENLAAQYLMLLAAGLEPVILGDEEMERVIAKFADYGQL